MSPPRFAAPVCILAAVLLGGCVTTPTGRHQLSLYSAAQMDQLGEQAFSQVSKQTPVSHNAAVNSFVQCVVRPLAGVAGRSQPWNVTVFQSKEANAFALPGGNIGVYTGILTYARNGAELATVIGHEMGHVLAQHMNARLSADAITQLGLQAVSTAIGSSGPQQQQVLSALGLGAQVGVLQPFSRAQESEADLIGFNLMAQAGFDPQASIQMWHNMESLGSGPPAFLSDHPATSDRIAALEAHMPQALQEYRQAQAAGRNPQCGSAPGA